MRFTSNHYAFFIVLGFLTACKNNSSTPKNTPSVSEASVDKTHNNYRHFRGTIGDFPVTMDIVETRVLRNNVLDLPRISGFYSYDKK